MKPSAVIGVLLAVLAVCGVFLFVNSQNASTVTTSPSTSNQTQANAETQPDASAAANENEITSCKQLSRSIPVKTRWALAEKLSVNGSEAGKQDCLAVMFVIQLQPAEELQRLKIPMNPDYMMIMNHKMLGADAEHDPTAREQMVKFDRILRENMLTIHIKPTPHFQDDCWIPEVTVHNNAALLPVKHVLLKFAVYDGQKNLVWDGNMLIDSLNADSSYTGKASGRGGSCIPNSVHSEVEVTDKDFSQ